MGDWYEIGVTLGLGVAAGLLLAGLLAAWRYGLLTSVLGALAIGALAGLLVKGWIGLPGAYSMVVWIGLTGLLLLAIPPVVQVESIGA